MISAMDEGVGNLIEYLENNHLLNNTLILFISDNGATGVGSNAPLNGHKGSMWEGGHRVPAIAYWKGKTVAGVSNETIISMDLFPTLVELINPGYSKDVSLDGSSIMSEILPDDKYNPIPIRSLFWRYKDRKAVRLDDWKLMVDNSEHLFNLKDDIGEKDNLAMEHPEKRDSLLTLLNKWESEMSKYPPRTN